jgi:Domain of unknown function (DUF4157)
MEKAVPAGGKSSQSSTRESHTPSRQSQPQPQTGRLSQLAGLANRSPQVQAQLKLARAVHGSAHVESQMGLAGQVNAASPVAAQLKDMKEKKPAAQPKGKMDPKKKVQGKFEDAAQAKGKDKKHTAQSKPKEKPRQGKFVDGAAPAQLEEAPSANRTGLPDNVKAGVESLSGVSLDNVKVHYNSGKPAQLNALAYAQGTDIHVAPGQEQHVPHEAWHVVQQHQGRVQPTTQAKGVAINDDSSLEREADVMGAKAAATQRRTVK